MTDIDPPPPPQSESAQAARGSVFERLSASWERRAQVRSFRWDTAPAWDPAKDDFLPQLLPFGEHPAFVGAPAADRARCLAAAWLAFNENQVGLELSIVIPTCVRLLQGHIPGAQDPALWATVSEALTDESYHIVLTQQGSETSRERRGLRALQIPRSAVIAAFERVQAEHTEEWQRDLILLASTVVTEIFIHAHLRMMSYPPDSLQPLHGLVTRTHFTDELAHAGLFRAVLKASYTAMDATQRAFFASVVHLPVRWFADTDLEQWAAILDQIEFPGRDEILAEARALRRELVDYSSLVKVCDEVGITGVRERLAAWSAS
jgi:alpha-N-dichloroacetyl-p-aminophenylserinol N-oxygenase